MELADYLKQLKGKENVKILCMDLSSTYRSIVKKYFPNATIVADLFMLSDLCNINACRHLGNFPQMLSIIVEFWQL